MKKLAIIVCILTIALSGCNSGIKDTWLKMGITGAYVFSEDSKYAGKSLQILAEGDSLFVYMESHKTELLPDAGNFRFTTGDMNWNEDKTAKELEWFLIAHDPDRKQYYMGSTDNPQWKQYLTKQYLY
jgi:hypothetical protein